jgi:hypothetical protein
MKTGLEVHHIRQRKDANGSRFDDGDARDDARNLIVVCDKCHDAHHNGDLSITPLKMTSNGPVRVDPPIETITKQKQRKSQWLPEEREIIEKLLIEYKSSPLKRIIVLLKEEEITISESSLRTIRNSITQQQAS